MLKKALLIMPAALAVAMHPVAAGAADAAGADWAMNEPPGATVMHDSAGAVDDSAKLPKAGVTPTGSFYHFSGTHGIVVPDSPELNPGARDFDLYVTFRWSKRLAEQSLIQKGIWNQPGGQYKINVNGTLVDCRVKEQWVKVSRALPLNTWHTIGCHKRVDRVYLTIDGKIAKTVKVTLGSVSSPKRAVQIGGQTNDCPKGDCDLYTGDLRDVILSYPPAGTP